MGCRKLQLPDSFHLVNCHHEAHEVHEDDFYQNHSIKYRGARFKQCGLNTLPELSTQFCNITSELFGCFNLFEIFTDDAIFCLGL